MSVVTTVPKSSLRDINEVTPLSSSDDACLTEVREVLEKHGRRDRFGLTLLHGHFPVGEGEILVEQCDHMTRTLTTRPEKHEEVANVPSIDTAWRFGDRGLEVLAKCRNRGPHAMVH